MVKEPLLSKTVGPAVLIFRILAPPPMVRSKLGFNGSMRMGSAVILELIEISPGPDNRS